MSLRIHKRTSHACADAAAGASVAVIKEKFFEPLSKKLKSTASEESIPVMTSLPEKSHSLSAQSIPATEVAPTTDSLHLIQDYGSKSDESNYDTLEMKRRLRLEQNRKAAKVARERKKNMVQDLQGCISRIAAANASLNAQNEELERLVSLAEAHMQRLEGTTKETEVHDIRSVNEEKSVPIPQADQPVASADTPASHEDSVASLPSPSDIVSPEEPPVVSGGASESTITGATLQAMMSLQQATSAMQSTMQAAMPQTQFPTQPPTVVSNPQQVYMDHLAAFVLQQSLTATMGTASTSAFDQALLLASLRMGPFFPWQQQHLQQQNQN